MLILWLMLAGLTMTHACGGGSSSSGGTPDSGDGDGVTITNEVSSPADMGVGDIIMAQFTSSSPAEFDFSGADTSSKYYLAVGSLDTGSATHSIRLSNMTAIDAKSSAEIAYEEEAEAEAEWQNWTLNDAFSQRLRNIEAVIATDPKFEVATPKAEVSHGANLRMSVYKGVGDTETLSVLRSLTSLSFTSVTGRVKCVTDNLIMYLDTEVEDTNPSDLTDSDIETLCENFDSQIEQMQGWFGESSDVNGDGRVAALLTPQVNRLGAMGGGIITGFFLSTDLYSVTGSNEREIVYTLVPDSYGDYGTVLPKAFTIDNLLTAVLPHEFQHVISYNQHVFEGEGSSESNWLNEGLSHLTEDLVGFGQENYSRVGIYFYYPYYYPLTGTGSPGLGERGAAYLFMRFLYEQHSNPSAFLWALFHSNASGATNVETAYAGTSEDFDQFEEFFMRWMTALAMTSRGLTQDSRYIYESRTWNSTTGHWQGMCLVCDADDGRGTELTGPGMSTYSGSASFSVYSSAIKFYDIISPPADIDFTSTSSGTYGAVLIRRQ